MMFTGEDIPSTVPEPHHCGFTGPAPHTPKQKGAGVGLSC